MDGGSWEVHQRQIYLFINMVPRNLVGRFVATLYTYYEQIHFILLFHLLLFIVLRMHTFFRIHISCTVSGGESKVLPINRAVSVNINTYAYLSVCITHKMATGNILRKLLLLCKNFEFI